MYFQKKNLLTPNCRMVVQMHLKEKKSQVLLHANHPFKLELKNLSNRGSKYHSLTSQTKHQHELIFHIIFFYVIQV